MIMDLTLQVGNLRIQKGDVLLQSMNDWLSRDTRGEAVMLLLAHRLHIT